MITPFMDALDIIRRDYPLSKKIIPFHYYFPRFLCNAIKIPMLGRKGEVLRLLELTKHDCPKTHAVNFRSLYPRDGG